MTKRKSTLVQVFPGIDHPKVVAAAIEEARKSRSERLFRAIALVATSRSAIRLFSNAADEPVDTVYLGRTLDQAIDELQAIHEELGDEAAQL
jgi:hypothetical protein